jgi:hypothetical protein
MGQTNQLRSIKVIWSCDGPNEPTEKYKYHMIVWWGQTTEPMEKLKCHMIVWWGQTTEPMEKFKCHMMVWWGQTTEPMEKFKCHMIVWWGQTNQLRSINVIWSCPIYDICVCLSRVVSILCCVFALFFFVLCTLCCLFLWIVYSKLPLRYSLTFM